MLIEPIEEISNLEIIEVLKDESYSFKELLEKRRILSIVNENKKEKAKRFENKYINEELEELKKRLELSKEIQKTHWNTLEYLQDELYNRNNESDTKSLIKNNY